MRKVILLGTNVLLTILTAGSVGPAVLKMDRFGLVGWAGRVPFYLLQLYIGAGVVMLARRTPLTMMKGSVVGCALALPLALWSVATHCVPEVQAVYLASGALQGAILARLAPQAPLDA